MLQMQIMIIMELRRLLENFFEKHSCILQTNQIE